MTHAQASERLIFLAALDKGSREERAAYLVEACAGDPRLRADVEALLAAHDRLGELPPVPGVSKPGVSGDEPPPAEPTPGQSHSRRRPPPTPDGNTPPEQPAGTTPSISDPVADAAEQAPPLASVGVPPGSGAPSSAAADADATRYSTPMEHERWEPLALAGPVIPGYEILSVLDRGAMGVVYKARHIHLKRLAAVKMMRGGEEASPQERARFRAEAETVASLQHPHIVPIYDIGEANGQLYLALEFVGGGNLKQKLDGTPQPPQEAARLLETLARTMEVAHQRHIIHRDLKSANILLTTDGIPKIADFGLAKRLDQGSGHTLAGDILGTPSYMAPEQAHGRVHEVGRAADVYALGAILYEVLTGRPPFKGASVQDTLEQVRTQEPVPPRQLQPNLPRDLETICLKCLRKEPPKRYGSAGDLADDLHRFLHGEPIRARPVRAWERAMKWAKRRPRAVAEILLLAVLVVGLTVAAIVWRQHKAQQLAGLRAEVGKWIADGRKALDNGRFQDAQLFLTEAQTKAQAHPDLKDLQDRAADLNAEAGRGLRDEQRRAQADEVTKDFLRLRDEAVFLGSGLLAEAGLCPDPLDAQAAAWKALRFVGVTRDGSAGPTDHFAFTPEQRQEVVANCYGLFVLLAEMEMQQDHPDRSTQALRLLDRAAQLGLTTRAYHLARARALKLQGKEPEAVAAEAAAARQVRASALDFFLLGVTAYRQGDLRQATQDFQQALERPGEHFWPGYLLALCYLRQQQTGQALATLTAYLDRQPTPFPWCRLLQGFAYTQQGDFPAAEAAFAKAEEINREGSPDRRREAAYSIRLNRAALRMREAQAADTLAHVIQAALPVAAGWPGPVPAPLAEAVREQAYALARDDLERAAGLHAQPYPYQAHARLALLYQARRQFDEALGQLQQALKTMPQEPSVLASLYRQRARLHGERGDLHAALADWDRVLKGPRPDTPRARALLAEDYLEVGRLLHQRQRYEQAVEVYQKASRVRPDNAEASFWLGRALLEAKRYAEAVDALDQYQQRKSSPPTPELYWYRGQALKEHGAALVAAKRHPEATRAFAGAVRDFTSWLDHHPQDDQVLVARGWSHLAMNEPSSATVDFDAAISLNPERAEPYVSRGYARAKTGQSALAIRDVRQGLGKGRADARAYLIAAKVFALAAAERPGPNAVTRTGYYEQALKWLQKTLESAPHPAAFWRDHVERDVDLRLLRNNPRYVEWERTYSRPTDRRAVTARERTAP